MRQSIAIESLESRSFFSAVASAAAASVVRHAATVVPLDAPTGPAFEEVHGSRHNAAGQALTDTANGIDLDSAIKITFDSNGFGSIDASHLFRAAVQVTDTTAGITYVSTDFLTKVITSGGGDVLIISPKNLLTASHSYSVELNGAFAVQGSNDYRIRTGSSGSYDYFPDTTFNFTTGTYFASSSLTSAFSTAATQANAGNHGYTCVTTGPDGSLYAADTEGYLYKFAIGSDGTLGTPTVIDTVRTHNGGNRLITGIAFSPRSKATDVPVIYVSHSVYQFGNNGADGTGIQNYAQNFSGKISVVSGTDYSGYQDLVVNIPRSAKDHTNNQIVFQPNGSALYFGLAGMNAMGAADSTWGNRVENIYTGTILQLRLGSATNGINTYIHSTGGPVNLLIDGTNQTATGVDPTTTHYNIFKGTNPLRIYADGIRNDYDMVFASNGHLYAGINGSSAGGNTPATPSDLSTVPVTNRPDKDAKDANGNYLYKNADGTYKTYTGPASPALTNVAVVEEDTLLDVQNGAYYGHPNPARGEYILDDGNPTSHTDAFEIAGSTGYAVGQASDRNYTSPVYDFGQDYSPDGLIQYNSVGGKNADLDGYVLVCRYASGGDILALHPNTKTGAIDAVQTRIPGLTNLGTPLDITEDPNTGNLYVAVLTNELNAGSIVMLKPTTSGTGTTGTPHASLNKTKLGFYATPGDKNGDSGTVTLTNTGTGPMTIDVSATKISGKNRKNFVVTNLPSNDLTLAVNQSFTFDVKGVLAPGSTDTAFGTLAIATDDPTLANGYATTNLRVFDA